MKALKFQEIIAQLTYAQKHRQIKVAQETIDKFKNEVDKDNIGHAIKNLGPSAIVANYFIIYTENFFELIEEAESADEVLEISADHIQDVTHTILDKATYILDVNADDQAWLAARARHLENIKIFREDFQEMYKPLI